MNHGFMARALSEERKAHKQAEREAQKKLIAAAPDLLAACEYTIEKLKGVKGKTFPILPIIQAITKAT